MGRPDYLLDVRSRCLQDGKEAILLPGCRDLRHGSAAFSNCARASWTSLIHRRRTPRWKRTSAESGLSRASGPRRENAAEGSSLSKRADRGGNLGVQPVGRELERAVEGGTRRDRLADPLQAPCRTGSTASAPPPRPPPRARRAAPGGDLPVRPGGGSSAVKNDGSPGAILGMEDVAGAARLTASRARPRPPSATRPPPRPAAPRHRARARGGDGRARCRDATPRAPAAARACRRAKRRPRPRPRPRATPGGLGATRRTARAASSVWPLS